MPNSTDGVTASPVAQSTENVAPKEVTVQQTAATTTPQTEVKTPAAKTETKPYEPKIVRTTAEMLAEYQKLREVKAQANLAKAEAEVGQTNTPSVATNVPAETKPAETTEQQETSDATTESQANDDVEDVEDVGGVEDVAKTSKRALKRIDKLTARLKDTEAQLNELRNSQKQPQQEVTAEAAAKWGEYAKVNDPAKLREELSNLESARELIQDALDLNDIKTDEHGNEYLLDVNGKRYNKQQLISMRRDFNAKIKDVLPSRIAAVEQVSQAKNVWNQYKEQKMEFLKNTEDPVYQELEQAKQDKSWGHIFNEIPHAEVVWAAGLKWLAEQEKVGSVATSKPSTIAKKVAPVPSKPSVPQVAAPSAINETVDSAARQQAQVLFDKARQTRKPADIEKYMAFKREHNLR